MSDCSQTLHRNMMAYYPGYPFVGCGGGGYVRVTGILHSWSSELGTVVAKLVHAYGPQDLVCCIPVSPRSVSFIPEPSFAHGEMVSFVQELDGWVWAGTGGPDLLSPAYRDAAVKRLVSTTQASRAQCTMYWDEAVWIPITEREEFLRQCLAASSLLMMHISDVFYAALAAVTRRRVQTELSFG